MYILDAYNNGDRNKMIRFIEQNSFADLVTCHAGVLCSNKVPFLFDAEKNELYGHLGNGNEQLIDIDNASDALVIFSGAHSYISPQWYISNNAVPTWNFQTLQCRGKPSLVGRQELLEILERLTGFHEASFSTPWTIEKLEPEAKEKMLSLITGFKIEITDTRFKEKMSQIRKIEDRQNIIKVLASSDSPMSKAVSDIMRESIES